MVVNGPIVGQAVWYPNRPFRDLPRRQHTEGSFPHLEFNGTISDQLTIEFHRNFPVAGHAQPSGLKVFDLWNTNVGAEYDVLEILDDFQVTELFECDDVKQAVVDGRVFKERK